jgi:hypothetical protein
MKIPILLVCASALAATAGATPFCTTSPGTWCEEAVGDAGAFPKTSQATMGTGALSSIIGIIGNGTAGSDLYSILIPDTGLFSATFAPYAANHISGESNAAIYLLNAQGRGVEAAQEGTALSSFNSIPGVYYIGIVPDGNDPEYRVSGTPFQLFTPFISGQDSLPVAGAEGISAYTHAGCGASCAGGYEISLTAAQYSNVPEAAPLALLGSGMSAIGLLRRFRRGTTEKD